MEAADPGTTQAIHITDMSAVHAAMILEYTKQVHRLNTNMMGFRAQMAKWVMVKWLMAKWVMVVLNSDVPSNVPDSQGTNF